MRAHPLRLSLAVALAIAAALLFASVGRGAATCTINWNVDGTGDWGVAANWKDNGGGARVPGPSDYVCIKASGTVDFGSDSPPVAGIDASGILNLSGGTLTLARAADDSYVHAMTMSGGTLAGAGTIHIPDGADFLWTAGVMAGTGTTEIDSGGDLIQTGPTTLADGRTLDVLGTLSIDPAGGLAQTGAASLVHVEPGGAMVRDDGTGTTTIAVPLRNDGTVEAGNGTTTGDGLYLSAGSAGDQTGSFSGSSTAPLTFTGGTWTMANPASLDGTIAIQGGALNAVSGYTVRAPTNLSLTAGWVGGAGGFQAPAGATIDWTGGAMDGSGTTTIASGAALNLSGSATLTRALVNNGSTLVRGGLIGGTGSSITNGGSLELRGSGQATVGGFSQTSSGTLTVRIAGTGTGNFGQLAVASTAQLAGRLAINTTFSPSPPDAFPVLTFGSRSGRFTSFSGTELGSGIGYSAQYNPGDLTLTVGSSAPPAAPTVTGTSPSTLSNDLTPEVFGSAPSGTTVTIYTNSTCTPPAAGSGSAADFSSLGIQATAAANGPTTFYAVASDSVNRSSACSITFASYHTDSIAPAVTLTAPRNGTSTTSHEPTFSGAAGAAAGDTPAVTLNLYAGHGVSGSPAMSLTRTPNARVWSLTPSTPLPYGTYTAQATQADSAGNLGRSTASTFTIAPPAPVPAVTRISPSSGTAAGGSQVLITGTGLSGATQVRFGARPAARFIVNASTQITATAPAGSGTVAVAVSTPGGVSAQTAAARYTYVGAPVLGRTVEALPVRGSVLVRAPRARSFTPITALTTVALGSALDTTRGDVRVIAAAHRGGTQSADLRGGAFTLTQASNAILQARLASMPSSCSRSRGKAGAALTLGTAAGFRIRGRYGSATTTRAQLLIQERCNGTYFKVLSGSAVVQGFRHHRKRTLRRGGSYLAVKR